MTRRKQKVSIYRIAAEAGVSAATVSRVLNKRIGVGEETRKRISELFQKHNFVPDYPAMKSAKIAVVTSSLGEYVAQALYGIYPYAEENGLTVNIIMINSFKKESLLETLRDQQSSGAILLMSDEYRQELDTLRDSDLPIVLVDTMSDNDKIGFIDNNSYSGSVEAVKYLLKLGHRKIGYLQRFNPTLNQLQRFKAYENTMKTEGITITPEWIEYNSNGMDGMKRLLKRTSELSAVLAVDDYIALGAMTAIHEAGLKIPEDISIIGFDNYPETEIWYPALTTVNHPIAKAGYMAVEAIHAGLRNPSNWLPPREILPTNLVIRKSTSHAKP